MLKTDVVNLAIQILQRIDADDPLGAYELALRQTPDTLEQLSQGLMCVAAACEYARISKVSEQ